MSAEDLLNVVYSSAAFLQILYQTVTHPLRLALKLHPQALGWLGKPADVINPWKKCANIPRLSNLST